MACRGKAVYTDRSRARYTKGRRRMRSFTAVIERCSDTGLYVGHVPGFSGAHSQGESLDELHGNLEEVIRMLLEDGDPEMDAEFAGIQTITVT